MIREKEYNLDCDDISRVADMLEGAEPDNVVLRKEYAKILRLVSKGMCWDDTIVTTGDYTVLKH
jgi:hypothetical protein